MTKQSRAAKAARWKARQVAKGYCPHCGKPCAPYRECDRRRLLKQLYYHFKRMEQAGILSIQRAKGQASMISYLGNRSDYVCRAPSNDGDRRNLPRLRKTPLDLETIVYNILLKHGKMSETEIEHKVCEIVVAMRNLNKRLP